MLTLNTPSFMRMPRQEPSRSFFLSAQAFQGEFRLKSRKSIAVEMLSQSQALAGILSRGAPPSRLQLNTNLSDFSLEHPQRLPYGLFMEATDRSEQCQTI